MTITVILFLLCVCQTMKKSVEPVIYINIYIYDCYNDKRTPKSVSSFLSFSFCFFFIKILWGSELKSNDCERRENKNTSMLFYRAFFFFLTILPV